MTCSKTAQATTGDLSVQHEQFGTKSSPSVALAASSEFASR